MKSRTLTLISAMTLPGALAISVQLSAQEQPRDPNRALAPRFKGPHATKGSLRGTGVSNKADEANEGSAPSSHIITFDAPGAGTGSEQGTFPLNLNAGGTVIGNFTDANGVNHGFQYN